MKHFIVELTYTIPAEQLGAATEEHRKFLKIGYDRGWLLFSGPQVPKRGGIIVARAPSLEELQQYLADDPYKLRELATYRFVEFDPVRRQAFMEEWVTS